jgi:hypothetical protein
VSCLDIIFVIHLSWHGARIYCAVKGCNVHISEYRAVTKVRATLKTEDTMRSN